MIIDFKKTKMFVVKKFIRIRHFIQRIINDNQSKSNFSFFIFFDDDDVNLNEKFNDIVSFSQITIINLFNQIVVEKRFQINFINVVDIIKFKIELNQFRIQRDIVEIFIDEKFIDNRRFFLQHAHDNDFFFMFLYVMFFVVNRKHFAKIFREIFMSKHFHRLINDYFARNAFNIEFENVVIIDNIKNLIHFIKCFEIYCQIVLKLIQFFVYKKFNRIFFV